MVTAVAIGSAAHAASSSAALSVQPAPPARRSSVAWCGRGRREGSDARRGARKRGQGSDVWLEAGKSASAGTHHVCDDGQCPDDELPGEAAEGEELRARARVRARVGARHCVGPRAPQRAARTRPGEASEALVARQRRRRGRHEVPEPDEGEHGQQLRSDRRQKRGGVSTRDPSDPQAPPRKPHRRVTQQRGPRPPAEAGRRGGGR